MVTTRGVCAFLLLALLASGCSSQPGASVPAGAPAAIQTLAVVVHERKDEVVHQRVAAHVDGQPLAWLSPEGDTGASPSWAADGSVLGYLLDRQLFVYEPSSRESRLLPVTIPPGQAVFALGTDGGTVAVAQGDQVLLQPVRAHVAPRQVAAGDGCKVYSLRWSRDGQTLVILCYPDPTIPEPRILFLDVATQTLASQVVPGAGELLGQRPGGSWLLAHSVDGAGGVIELSGPGPGTLVHRLEEEQFVQGYVPGRDELIVAGGSEDENDPVELSLAAPGQAARPWLRRFPRLADLSIIPDGTLATFVDRLPPSAERPGGDVYVVAPGQDDARLVLKASELHSFFHPALQPTPSGRARPPAPGP